MARREDNIRPGSRVNVRVQGVLREGVLVGYVEGYAGREAEVRLDGDLANRRFATFAVRRVGAGERWWWPNDHMLRVALVTLFVTAIGAAAAVAGVWLAGTADTKDTQQTARTSRPDSTVSANPPASPPAHVRRETAGGRLNTWTDYAHAGGKPGRVIPAYATVTVDCRVRGFKVRDGDTWWYRIRSRPWNGVYYASADGFYNNGKTAGTLEGTPFVDTRVPLC